jgi:hypothetical protein
MPARLRYRLAVLVVAAAAVFAVSSGHAVGTPCANGCSQDGTNWDNTIPPANSMR